VLAKFAEEPDCDVVLSSAYIHDLNGKTAIKHQRSSTLFPFLMPVIHPGAGKYLKDINYTQNIGLRLIRGVYEKIKRLSNEFSEEKYAKNWEMALECSFSLSNR